jgi:hypothetical protein
MTHTRPRGRRLGQLLSLLFWVSISTVVFGAHEIPNESCNDDTDTHTDRDTQHTMLLQKRHQLMLKAAEQSPQVDSSLSGLLPIEWVHVRKSGTSFMYTLFHTKGACPNMPKEAEIDFNESFDAQLEEWKCNASVVDLDRFWHHGIEYRPPGGFNSAKGRFMMMMRQPEQRILSEYNFYCENRNRKNKNKTIDKTLEDIVAERRGCVTQMLTSNERRSSFKDPDGLCMVKVSDDFLRTQLVEAKLRLQTGFSFVGLTEQWDLSICLFSTMFNQKCYAKQFENSRPTKGPLAKKQSSVHYDTAPLNGWRDPYDNELYAIAVDIFEKNLKLYNVSESSCEPCWSEAGLL